MQNALNLAGFILIVLGLGLEGPLSFLFLSAAIVTFLVAIFAGGAKQRQGDTDRSQAPPDQ